MIFRSPSFCSDTENSNQNINNKNTFMMNSNDINNMNNESISGTHYYFSSIICNKIAAAQQQHSPQPLQSTKRQQRKFLPHAPRRLLLVLFLSIILSPPIRCSGSSSSSTLTTTTTVTTTTRTAANKKIVVIGSVNADTFLAVKRLPTEGENLCTTRPPVVNVPGGKGCTQAVAAAKLVAGSCTTANDDDDDDVGVVFVGQFGRADDPTVQILKQALQQLQDDNNAALPTKGVDLTYCRHHDTLDSGRGYVFWQQSTGSVSAVVSGGSNQDGWGDWKHAWREWQAQQQQFNDGDEETIAPSPPASLPPNVTLPVDFDALLDNCQCVLLQREVPEEVNLLIAHVVQAKNRHQQHEEEEGHYITLLQDVGGEDRPISKELLHCCDYIVPNESELKRLVASLDQQQQHEQQTGNADDIDSSFDVNIDDNNDEGDDDLLSSLDKDSLSILSMAQRLQFYGARNVLVTRGSRGCFLLLEKENIKDEKEQSNRHRCISRRVLIQAALPVERVVDETGAGDCFRAAFATALILFEEERQNNKHHHQQQKHQQQNDILQECLQFACAAGACSVERHGAVPSTPTRQQVEQKLTLFKEQQQQQQQFTVSASDAIDTPRGGSASTTATTFNDSKNTANDKDNGGGERFPFMIGSRLNSMKDRPDLWGGGGKSLQTAHDYVKRQGTIRGLTCVDFNYPQHFTAETGWNVDTQKARDALEAEGLKAGAVCLRFPSSFARGAMNHPDPMKRRQAIELTKQAAQVALDLGGCREVVVWSAYDGYDYPFQVDYHSKWNELVDAFQEVCDAYPSIKFSLEYKPTDENTRFFTVPSTGAAILMVQQVNRSNFGLTLDVGHMLMAGENPGQSIAMVAQLLPGKKLFGIQLNDGYTRLAAEDGLMFGSVHPSMALEIMYHLRKFGFDGHFYFDTFPQRSDPVKEAEFNIRQVKAFWKAAGSIDETRLHAIMAEHDAIGALELVKEALRNHL